jgi:peptide/nickel transport system substrate-binding protein
VRSIANWSLVVVTLGLLVAGCGKSGSSSGQSGSSATDALTAQTPPARHTVGSVTWDILTEPTTVDWAKTYSSADLYAVANMCEPLLYQMPDGSISPALATSVAQPDPTTLVVHLRQGVTFWDGHPMTADDVVFSIRRVLAPQTASYWGSLGHNIKSVTKVDADTVRIDLSRPDAFVEDLLSTPLGDVAEQAYVAKAGSKYGTPSGGVMCTGPYQFGSWAAGDSMILKRYDGWWNAAHRKQWNAQLKLVWARTDATRTAAMLNGSDQGGFAVPASTYTELTHSSSGRVYRGPSPVISALVVANFRGSMGNPLLREAVSKTIDYRGLLSSQFQGSAQPLRALAAPPALGNSSAQRVYETAYAQLPPPKQDLQEAKRLVRQSGVTHPVVRIAVTNDTPEAVALGLQLAQDGKKVGLDVQLRQITGSQASELFSSDAARSKVDLFYAATWGDLPDPAELYAQIGIPTGAQNYGGYNNPTVASLLQQAVAEADPTKRAELTVRAQKIMMHDLPWIPIASIPASAYMVNSITGVQVSFLADIYWPWGPDIGAP